MPAYTWTTAETITAAKLNALETEAWSSLNILGVASTTSEQFVFASTSYSDISPSVSFTPKTTSVLVAILSGGAYVSGTTGIGILGVRVNSVDYDICHWKSGNDGNTPLCSAAGAVLVTGLTAGTTYTAQSRLKTAAAPGDDVAINRSGTSRATIIVLGIGK